MIALCAMMLRAMIPAGYMPDWGAGRAKPWLAICRAGALQMLAAPAQRSAVEPLDHSAGSHFDCPYTALATPGLASASWPALTLSRQLPVTLTRVTRTILADSPRRPPARAPPPYSVFR